MLEFCPQGSASDCVLVCLLAARYAAIKALRLKHPFVEDGVLLSKLMAYCSKEVRTNNDLNVNVFTRKVIEWSIFTNI